MTRTAYVAGPMTNRPYFNFPAFDAVAAKLRDMGWTVFNPHEHDQGQYPTIDTAEATKVGDVVALADEIGFSFAGAMAWDLKIVAETDAIVLLPEWETSTGARTERFVAEMTGSDIYLALLNAAGEWIVLADPEQKRMLPAVVGKPSEPPWDGNWQPVEARILSYGDLKPASPELLELLDPRNVDGTTIKTSSTGGQKGAKSVELDRLPQAALRAVAEHFHQGSEKYPDPAPGVANWSLGYDWSLSINALLRHLSAWQSGEDDDPEFGTSHLRAVGFHALVLLEYELQGWGTDDRRTPEARERYLAEQTEPEPDVFIQYGDPPRAYTANEWLAQQKQPLHERYRTFADLNGNMDKGGIE